MSANHSDNIDITGTWMSDDDDMLALLPNPPEHKDKEVANITRARRTLRPCVPKTIVALHGGMRVEYPHGWLMNQQCALMYSMVREVCHPLRGLRDDITLLIMPYVFCGCCSPNCHDPNLLPWVPPYVTHEARVNGVLMKRNFQSERFRMGLRTTSEVMVLPPWLNIGIGNVTCPDRRWYAVFHDCDGEIWLYMERNHWN